MKILIIASINLIEILICFCYGLHCQANISFKSVKQFLGGLDENL